MVLLESGAPSMRRAERSSGRSMPPSPSDTRPGPLSMKKVDPKAAWREARELLWLHRRRLAIGLGADAGEPPRGPGAAGPLQVR